jgi:predicted GNAT family acetyltransferase
MRYRVRPDGVWSITHTFVPPALEGRGLARALLDRAIADARAEGARIEPLRSYVRAVFQRTPEWADLLAR